MKKILISFACFFLTIATSSSAQTNPFKAKAGDTWVYKISSEIGEKKSF